MNSDSSLIKAIEQTFEHHLEQAKIIVVGHGRTMPKVTLNYDLRGTTAGQCHIHPPSKVLLRFNLQLAKHNTTDFLQQTVAHELAHAVTWRCYPKAKPHGAEWRSVMQAFGIAKPQRCHRYQTEQVSSRRQRTWAYQCDCQLHQLSTTRHNRIQSGKQRYFCKQCQQELAQQL